MGCNGHMLQYCKEISPLFSSEILNKLNVTQVSWSPCLTLGHSFDPHCHTETLSLPLKPEETNKSFWDNFHLLKCACWQFDELVSSQPDPIKTCCRPVWISGPTGRVLKEKRPERFRSESQLNFFGQWGSGWSVGQFPSFAACDAWRPVTFCPGADSVSAALCYSQHHLISLSTCFCTCCWSCE